jgi:hypothetical protein
MKVIAKCIYDSLMNPKKMKKYWIMLEKKLKY